MSPPNKTPKKSPSPLKTPDQTFAPNAFAKKTITSRLLFPLSPSFPMSPKNKHRTLPLVDNVDDVYASHTSLMSGTVAVAAMATGPGQKAVGEVNGQRLNQDTYFMATLAPHAEVPWSELFSETDNITTQALVDYDHEQCDAGEHWNSGCTALVAHLQHDKINIANAGDCTAKLVYKENGRYHVLNLTHAHRASTESEQTRIGLLPNTPLRISTPSKDTSPRFCLNDRNAKRNYGLSITRGFGAKEYAPGFTPVPEISTFDLKQLENKTDAFLITASDGFADYVSDEELADFFDKNPTLTLAQAADALRKKAYLEKGSHDNITVGVHFLHPGLCVGVFDGFGIWGHIAATRAAMHFQKILQLINAKAQLCVLDMPNSSEYTEPLQQLKRQLTQTLQTAHAFQSALNVAAPFNPNLEQDPCLTLAQDTRAMLTTVNDPLINSQVKLHAVQNFHDMYVDLPLWKKYQRTLIILLSLVIGALFGAIVGGLCSSPLFGVGAIAGAFIGASLAMSLCGGITGTATRVHFAYHLRPEVGAKTAIEQATLYPRLTLA